MTSRSIPLPRRITQSCSLCFSLLLTFLTPPARADAIPPRTPSDTLRAAGLRPRPAVDKPAHTLIRRDLHHTDKIYVKFEDSLYVRLRNGDLTDFGDGSLNEVQGILQPLVGKNWERVHSRSEEDLAALRRNAQENLGRAVADLNLEFYLLLPAGVDPGRTIDALNTLESVEIALPIPLPVVPPVPPNYQPNEGFLNAPPNGINATVMWQIPGGTGAASKIADLEFGWNFSHLDLGAPALLGANPNSTNPSYIQHGTAVMGVLRSVDNGFGTTGIAHDAELFAVATIQANGTWNISGAITTALSRLSQGDVILLEQQIAGPNYTGVPQGTQVGLVPVEWYQPFYNAILTAVGNGVVVVEAAGNGSQNLDDAVYRQGGAGPFLPQNDSGAFIVGAGARTTTVPRSRLGYSCYGSTLDLQGWGEGVYATGYGDLYSAEGGNLYYTRLFAGTSSASAVVAGASALVQSAYYTARGRYLSPGRLRVHMQATGSPQQGGAHPATQRIGPLPDVVAAYAAALSTADGDLNCDGVVNSSDVQAMILAVIDPGRYAAQYPSCDRQMADLDGNGLVNGKDLRFFIRDVLAP